MKRLTYLLFLIVPVFLLGQNVYIGRETVLDGIIHIEDSIHHKVPLLPRLCGQMETEKRRISVGDAELYVETEGAGIPVVLINGGPGGTHHYFHPWFSRLRNSHQLIYYDQRGTGFSDFNPGGGYSFRQAVQDLEKLRISLGISRWVVCGFSYGGGIAQYYTASYPERVSGLVLISTLPLFESEDFEDTQQKYISEAEQNMRNSVIREYVNGHLSLQALLYNLSLNGDWKRQHFYKPSRDEMIRSALYEWVNDSDFNEVMSRDYQRYDLSRVFETCPVPTVIFEGKNDLTWGSQKAIVLKNHHPNAQFIEFDQAAHGVFIDVPDQFFSSFTEFTNSISVPSEELLESWKKKTADMLQPQRSE